MGNDCFVPKTSLCRTCSTTLNHNGSCPRCRVPQARYHAPIQKQQPKQQPNQIPRTGIILSPPILGNPSPMGDGLYPPGAAFQNQNELIYEKAPTNPEQIIFKWDRRKTWFYPPVIKDFRIDIMRHRTFQEKMLWFRLNIEKLRISWQQGSDELHIDRGNLLKSSITALNSRRVNMRKEIKINFSDEEVMDAGGLQREWMHLILKQIFNQDNDIFQLCETQETAYKFKNDKSNNTLKMKQVARLLGTVLGKAVFDRIPVKCFLNRSILRQLASQAVHINDFFDFDQKIYESYTTILKGTNTEEIGLDFCVYKTNYDKSLEMVQLCHNGKSMIVNQANKQKYIQECIAYYTVKSCKEFIEELKQGLYRVIPMELLMIFQPYELEMIISGPPNIDTKDWQENTIYKGYTANSNVVKWFWTCVHSMDQDQLSNLLHYATGTTRVPVLGFKYLESNRNQISRFAIHRVDFQVHNPYPKSYTCFNRLELPNYSSFDELKTRLMTVVDEEISHFGLS